MTDVRLTAVNPEDSQVYPVACNDKGELLLDSGGASGDLDVTGNLTVAGSATLGAYPNGNGMSVDATYGVISARNDQPSATNGTQQAFRVYTGGQSQAEITAAINANGSATFARNKASISSTGAVTVYRDTTSPSHLLASLRSDIGGTESTVASVAANGSALFNSRVIAGTSALNDHTCIAYNSSSTNPTYYARNYDTNGGVFQGVNSSGATTTLIHANGDVYFAGNVTASNINFKLAPATVAAMPAPLIDEGFAADQELDLLSELIKMKLQIRDLNAFMQRSTQDDPET